MWIVVGVVVLIAVVAFVATFIRRPRGDDLSSVRNYHSALGTLEHLSERTSQQSVNITGPAEAPADSHVRPRFYSRSGAEGDLRPPALPGTTTSVPPVPVRGTDEFPDPETPLVFDDARPRDRYRRRSSRDAPLSRTDRIQRHALDSMNHRPRRWASVSIVIVAVVLFGVLAYVGSRRSPPSNHAHSVGATSSTAAAVSHSASTTGPKGKTKSATTTAPTQVVALSSTSSMAVYPVSSGAYRLTVTTTGPCWVSATTAMTGSTLWAGTLQAGATQDIQASGIVRVQLGTTAASMALNGVPVVLPTPLRSPFEATFEPSANSSSPGGAASTTGTTGAAGATGTTTTTSAP